jgi:hypothetical protein
VQPYARNVHSRIAPGKDQGSYPAGAQCCLTAPSAHRTYGEGVQIQIVPLGRSLPDSLGSQASVEPIVRLAPASGARHPVQPREHFRSELPGRADVLDAQRLAYSFSIVWRQACRGLAVRGLTTLQISAQRWHLMYSTSVTRAVSTTVSGLSQYLQDGGRNRGGTLRSTGCVRGSMATRAFLSRSPPRHVEHTGHVRLGAATHRGQMPSADTHRRLRSRWRNAKCPGTAR